MTREDVVNDDLNFMDGIPVSFARAAARTLSDLVWSVIMDNGGSFFSTGNANYQEGGGTQVPISPHNFRRLIALAGDGVSVRAVLDAAIDAFFMRQRGFDPLATPRRRRGRGHGALAPLSPLDEVNAELAALRPTMRAIPNVRTAEGGGRCEVVPEKWTRG